MKAIVCRKMRRSKIQRGFPIKMGGLLFFASHLFFEQIRASISIFPVREKERRLKMIIMSGRIAKYNSGFLLFKKHNSVSSGTRQQASLASAALPKRCHQIQSGAEFSRGCFKKLQ